MELELMYIQDGQDLCLLYTENCRSLAWKMLHYVSFTILKHL